MKYNKKTLIICIFLLIFTFVIVIVYKINNSEDLMIDENYDFLEKYDSNQYIPITITNEDIAKTYLNDYKNNMLNDLETAYNSLNKEYREKKFINFDAYREYVKDSINLSIFSMDVNEYNVSNIDGYKFFYIHDKNDNLYIFKEISIMNYEVYLDDNTVELK